jgi:S-adenosylmethionine-diacylgycerolhomoserine-N-methlytransferase
VGRVFISYALSMIPAWRQVVTRALEATGPGGRLYILDFGQQEAWPRWFKAMLFAWLRQFSVYPQAELEPELTKLANDTGAELEFRRLYRGYADYAVITKPA